MMKITLTDKEAKVLAALLMKGTMSLLENTPRTIKEVDAHLTAVTVIKSVLQKLSIGLKSSSK